MMKIKCAVHYEGQVKSVSVDSQKNLMEGLRKAKIPVPFSCGGEGICTTCRLFVEEGAVTDREGLEETRAKERGYATNERLSCQCYPLGPHLKIRLP